MKLVVLAVAAAALTACGTQQAPPGAVDRVCTDIGSVSGIGLDIAAGLAGQVTSASLTTCWTGACRDLPVDLSPSTGIGTSGCSGEACSAQATPTGGKNGFTSITDLPAEPITVTVVLTGAGTEITHQQVTATAALTYPNGPDCDPGGRQVQLTVAADGTVTSR